MRLHGGGKPAGLAIEFEDALHVCLDARCREDTARRDLDLFTHLVVIDGPVALKDHAVDDRVLDDADNEVRSGLLERGIGKKAGRKQRLERQVDPFGIERVARLDQKIGLDGPVLDPFIAFDLDGANALIGVHRLGVRCQKCSGCLA